jgi:CheY-like chemotaxis protein
MKANCAVEPSDAARRMYEQSAGRERHRAPCHRGHIHRSEARGAKEINSDDYMIVRRDAPDRGRYGDAAMMSGIARGQVLLVDDDDDVRETFGAYLADEGYHIVPFRRADVAWTALVRGLRPDAIVIDLALPGMSGGEFLRNLRAAPWGAAIPVLVFSAWERAERHALGADAVMAKGSEPVSVARVIDRLVAGGGSRERAAVQDGSPPPSRHDGS